MTRSDGRGDEKARGDAAPASPDLDFECVDPKLGGQLWRLELTDCAPGLRSRLENHLEVCDACRLRAAVEREVAHGLKAGTLHLRRSDRDGAGQPARPPADPQRETISNGIWGSLGVVGAMALAAGVTLVVLLPPHPLDADAVERGPSGKARFLRPVEGEVVIDRSPRLVWSPIPGASSYRLVLRQIGGLYVWESETSGTVLQLPDAAALPGSASITVALLPIPADLAPPQGFTVSFQTGGLRAFLAHRMRAAPNWTRLVASLGLASLGAAAAGRISMRRLPPRA